MTNITTRAADRTADTSTPILDVLAERWSPRSFDADAELTDIELSAALEAARWSPSASNSQPWRFIVGRRGSATGARILEHLMGFNQAWAPNAGALIVNVAVMTRPDGGTNPLALYDLGQAVAHLSVQAHADGLYAHQMAGVLTDELAAAFDLPDGMRVVSVTALGHLAPAALLPDEKSREREVAPRTRLPLSELVLGQP